MGATTLNPFNMVDQQIYDEVCLIDRSSSYEKYDSGSLLNVADNILNQTTHIVENQDPSKSSTPIVVDGNFQAASFDPKFSMLKQIACQMQRKPLSEETAHETTITVLKNLATFSWGTKALLALTAFAKDYGVFWHIAQGGITDPLAISLGLLHRVPAIVNQSRHKRAIGELNEMVRSILELVKLIIKVEELSSNKYNEEDVPHLSEAKTLIHPATYWAVLATAACSAQLSDSDFKYKLSRYDEKLQEILSKLKDPVGKIELPVLLPDPPTDIVEFLKALIFHNGDISQAKVFDGSTKQMVSIEVLKKKNVFLFISGLDSIEDEIVLLTPIYEALTKDKKDYKILWLPIVDEWNDKEKAKFEDLKKKMPWYVVEYVSRIGHRKYIGEKWQYKTKPIVVVLDPKGKVQNINAMHMIFSWGMEAFPFIDDVPLCEKWNWLWSRVLKYYPHIQKLIDDEKKYIFFYGGNDNVTIKKFQSDLKNIADNPQIKKADCEIEYFHLGKDYASPFWGEINELVAGHLEKSDLLIKQMEKFFSFKSESGWALLAKGRIVVIQDYKDMMFKVVENFEKWEEKVPGKGFDNAFKEYYDSIQAPRHCVHLEHERIRSKVPESVKCPDCDLVMKIASVRYDCCHGVPESAAADDTLISITN